MKKRMLSVLLAFTMVLSVLTSFGLADTAAVKAADTTQRQVVVYYNNNNWSEAYIHYQVNNGSWTSVPGKKMERTSEKEGYMWKYTIELGQEGSAMVCFNNGNGSWDSRNGQNYTVYSGIYGVKDGVSRSIYTPTEITGLSTSVSSPQRVGTTITLDPITTGERLYKYAQSRTFTITNKTTGKVTTLTSPGYEMMHSVDWTPEEAGEYEIQVVIHTTESVDVKYTTNYTITDKLKVTALTANLPSPQKVGTTIRLDATVENEAVYRGNTRKFTVTKDGVTEVIDNHATYAVYSATWTPTEPGTYDLTYYIKDYTGAEASKTIRYTITDEATNTITVKYYNANWSKAYIHYNVNGRWTSAPGVEMESLGNHWFTYTIDCGDSTSAVVCFNNGNGTWDSKNGINYTLPSVGEYSIKDESIFTGDVTNAITVKYYNADWSKAYIHYSVNGEWTSVPGVEMESLGNHWFTYTIDCGDSASAVVCFNNGNGTWDSRNGVNYSLNNGVGTYTVKDQSVTKTN